MPEDKRTKIGPTGPVRPATGTGTPPPGGIATSYLPAQGDPLLGQTLAGRYLIQKKLGEGGMGAVYLATHNVLEKQVALKVLHGEFARKADLVERFMQEAKAASRIRHENVIDISDFGTTPEGLVFFAMELLKGHDLHDEITRARLAGQLLPWERSKRIFLQICAALGAAHALGIIHRDLKPENIYLVDFLGEPDFVKLLDFGIAKLTEVAEGERKLTRTGMLFGTPEYMSPEQARGDTVDHRVDVYAMGCILFQLVTGRVPFEAENFMGVLSQHLTEPPPAVPPEVLDSIGAPRALAAVIAQALAKDRNQRFATIDELARAVRRASGDRETGPVVTQGNVPAPPVTQTIGRVKTQWTGSLSVPAAETAAAPATRSRLPLVIGAIVLVGGAVAATAVLTLRRSSAPAAASASGAPTAAPPASAPPVPPAPAPSPAPPPASPPASRVAAPPAEAPLPFERTQIRLDSAPSHAEVRDLASGKLVGRTPLSFTLPSSRAARQFEIHRKDYVDAVVEIVPDRQTIEYTEKLARGAAGAPAVVHHATDPARPAPPPGPDPAGKPGPAAPGPSDAPVIRPDPAVAKPEPPRPDPAPAKPAPPAPGPEDPDAITLKPDPSRSGAGSSTP